MAKYVITIFLSAAILSLWSSFSWKVLPLYDSVLEDLPNEAPIMDQLREHVKETGVYRFPGITHVDEISETSKINWLEKAQAGPFGYIFIRPDGINPLASGIYIRNFLINIFATMLAFGILFLANINSFKERWAVAIMLGCIIAIYAHLQMWNWMFFPLEFSLVNCFDAIMAWSFAGFILALGSGKKTQAVRN